MFLNSVLRLKQTERMQTARVLGRYVYILWGKYYVLREINELRSILNYLITPNDIHWRAHSHTNTHTQSVGLLWTSDRPVAETST
jgi:hypothetical protein